MRQEWSEKKTDDNNLIKQEIDISCDKVEREDSGNGVNDDKSKESEFMDVEEYFPNEIVDGETVFFCNICNEGLDNEQGITKHRKDNHESLMNDDSHDDTDLYEGFDEEGHRIV